MKKLIKLAGIAAIFAVIVFGMIACGGNDPVPECDEHDYSGPWQHNNINHWKVCTVDYKKSEEEPHVWDGPECNVCEYQRGYSIHELEFTLINNDTEYRADKRRYSTTSTNLVIPPEYEGKPVTEFGRFSSEATASERPRLVEIWFPDSIKTIGSNAFEDCTGLKTLDLRFIESISTTSFMGCGGLETITVAEDNTMYEVKGSSLVTKEAVGLTPAGNLIIGTNKSTIPEGITGIGANAFSGRKGLTSITIPESVKTIGRDAFRDTGLTSIVIPASVTSISPAFARTNLSSIEVADENTIYKSDGNCIISIVDTGIGPAMIPANTLIIGIKNSVIPEGVVRINHNAFELCLNLESITIPSTVEVLGSLVFQQCSNLKEIVIKNTSAVINFTNNYSSNTSHPLSTTGLNADTKVKVPSSLLAAYQAAPGWAYTNAYYADSDLKNQIIADE